MATGHESRNGNDIDDNNFDDLFNYDVDDAVFGKLDDTIPEQEAISRPPPPSAKPVDELGLDDEVKVRKNRTTVKLDCDRLMAPNGIPKLRKETREKLKFRGKGYEFRDTARLLSFYQLWADDLFKKAKFRDTLRIIEKLGHTKTIRWQREAWINEARNTKLRTGGSAAASSLSGVAEPVEHDGQLHPEVNDDDLYSLPTGRIPPSAKDKGKEKDIEPINPNALFLGTLSDESDEEMMDFDDAELEALMNERERSARGNATESNCDGGSGGENNNIIETPDESASADRLPACIRFSTPPPRTMPEDEVVDDEDAWEAMGM